MAKAWGLLIDEGARVLLHEIAGGEVQTRDFASVIEAQQSSDIDPKRLIQCSTTETPPPKLILPENREELGALRQTAPAALLPPNARIAIAGALTDQSDWEGVICLPEADVTHWVHVSAREIVSFQGAATGRLAAVFGAGNSLDKEALGDTMARPERLAAQLNAATLADDGAAVLGHLIGAELAAMRIYWLGQDVRIIGSGEAYGEALQLQGVAARIVPYAQAWRAGLMALGRAARLVS